MKYLIGTLIALFIFGSSFVYLARPPKDFPIDSVYSIKSGSSLDSISRSLETEKIIRSKGIFQFFVILFAGDKGVKAGDYLFDKSLSAYELAKRMVLGRFSSTAVKITIPEGYTNQEIAQTLTEKLRNFDATKFEEMAKDQQGYLFPDTYFFFPTASPAEAIRVMRENFDEKIAAIQDEIDQAKRKFPDIIIMASIVEREASGKGDREIISSILWKRLLMKMPLQADAAPETYERQGLPEMPIANPGLDSIKAALSPSPTPYLYYIHDKSGNIHYAKSFEEHKRNIAKYLKS